MLTFAQKYPFRAFVYKWFKDPIQSFFRRKKIYLPLDRPNRIWQIRSIGWITFYWDIGADDKRHQR